MVEFRDTNELRDAKFIDVDLSGARFIGARLNGAVLRGVDLMGVEIDSPWLFEKGNSLMVDGVDVVPFVDAELDKRFPGRSLRRAGDPAGLREAWSAVERGWEALLARVAAMPDGTVDIRVAGEWSFAETLRHLIMATDVWLGRAIRESEEPYHPIGLPYTRSDLPPSDIEKPSYPEVLRVRAEHQAQVRDFIAEVSETDLAVERRNPWAPDRTETTVHCLQVILEEEWEHQRYAVRDLDAIDAGTID